MSDSHRSVAVIDRDLQMTVTRRNRAKVQRSQLEQAMRSDQRHIDRLLEERAAALAAHAAAATT